MKLNPQSALRSLTDNFPNSGRLEWIGVRPQTREPVVQTMSVEAIVERGLAGDHRITGRAGSKRQVTLIQAEHIESVAKLMRLTLVRPELLRRNLVVSGINVLALKDQVFMIGDVTLEGTGLCEPCSRMETNLGSGGYNAMRGHGGITARVVAGGVLCVGDEVRVSPT